MNKQLQLPYVCFLSLFVSSKQKSAEILQQAKYAKGNAVAK